MIILLRNSAAEPLNPPYFLEPILQPFPITPSSIPYFPDSDSYQSTVYLYDNNFLKFYL
jgi:hypothetical protein